METASVTSVALSAEELRRPEFWRSHFPDLDLSSEVQAERYAGEMPYSDQQRLLDSQRMAEDGYTQGSHPALTRLAPILANAARRCVELRLPPVFLFLFNDVWRAFYALTPAISHILASPLCGLPDLWVWYIDPASGGAGWAPHVDKGPYSLDRDGRPLSVTVWIALTEATPLNSCIYVLPASRDRDYLAPQHTSGIDITHVRALPLSAGEWLCWNQALFHWGSASSRFAAEPRISMAFEFQRAGIAPFDQPAIPDPERLDFETKLRLIAKQILRYRNEYAVDPAVEQLARSLWPA
jgi:hypothetical protein